VLETGSGTMGGTCTCPESGKVYEVGNLGNGCTIGLWCNGGGIPGDCADRTVSYSGAGKGVSCFSKSSTCCEYDFPISADNDLSRECLDSWRDERAGLAYDGLYYDSAGNNIAMVMHVNMLEKFSPSFDRTKEIWEEVESFSKMWLKKAPGNLKHGWGIIQLLFYDVQLSLAKGVSSR